MGFLKMPICQVMTEVWAKVVAMTVALPAGQNLAASGRGGKSAESSKYEEDFNLVAAETST